MITEHDLDEAILECQGQRNPSTNTCLKLAAFLTIKREMFGKDTSTYSYAPPQESYHSDTEFGKAVEGKSADELMPLFDELMTTLSLINKPLYASVMRRVSGQS